MDRLLKQLSQSLNEPSSEHAEDSATLFPDYINEKSSTIPEVLNVGSLNEKLPALIPFSTSNGIVFTYEREKKRESYLFLQELLLQTIYKMPKELSKIWIFESETLVRELSLINEIKNTKLDTEFVASNTDIITVFLKKIEAIIKERNEMLGYKHKSISDYNTDKLENHPYHLCLISDFSKFWQGDHILFLERLLPQCQTSGIYFFIASEEKPDSNLLKNFISFSKGVDKYIIENVDKSNIINEKYMLKLPHIDSESSFDLIDKILSVLKS